MYCGEQLGYDKAVVEICIGEFQAGRKSNFPYYKPEDEFPDGEETKLIHAHCLHTMMDFVEVSDACSTLCNLCAHDLSADPEVYRLREGVLKDTGDEDFWRFEELRRDNASIFLCADCLLEGLGEGDHTAGCVLLGLA